MVNNIRMVYGSIPGVISDINSYTEIHITSELINSLRHKKIYTILDIMKIVGNPFKPRDLVPLKIYEEDYIKVLKDGIFVFGKRVKDLHKKKLFERSTVFKIYENRFERIEPWITHKYV